MCLFTDVSEPARVVDAQQQREQQRRLQVMATRCGGRAMRGGDQVKAACQRGASTGAKAGTTTAV